MYINILTDNAQAYVRAFLKDISKRGAHTMILYGHVF